MSAENNTSTQENAADKMNYGSWHWWPLISALERQSQEDFWVQGQAGLEWVLGKAPRVTQRNCLRKQQKKAWDRSSVVEHICLALQNPGFNPEYHKIKSISQAVWHEHRKLWRNMHLKAGEMAQPLSEILNSIPSNHTMVHNHLQWDLMSLVMQAHKVKALYTCITYIF